MSEKKEARAPRVCFALYGSPHHCLIDVTEAFRECSLPLSLETLPPARLSDRDPCCGVAKMLFVWVAVHRWPDAATRTRRHAAPTSSHAFEPSAASRAVESEVCSELSVASERVGCFAFRERNAAWVDSDARLPADLSGARDVKTLLEFETERASRVSALAVEFTGGISNQAFSIAHGAALAALLNRKLSVPCVIARRDPTFCPHVSQGVWDAESVPFGSIYDASHFRRALATQHIAVSFDTSPCASIDRASIQRYFDGAQYGMQATNASYARCLMRSPKPVVVVTDAWKNMSFDDVDYCKNVLLALNALVPEPGLMRLAQAVMRAISSVASSTREVKRRYEGAGLRPGFLTESPPTSSVQVGPRGLHTSTSLGFGDAKHSAASVVPTGAVCPAAAAQDAPHPSSPGRKHGEASAEWWAIHVRAELDWDSAAVPGAKTLAEIVRTYAPVGATVYLVGRIERKCLEDLAAYAPDYTWVTKQSLAAGGAKAGACGFSPEDVARLGFDAGGALDRYICAEAPRFIAYAPSSLSLLVALERSQNSKHYVFYGNASGNLRSNMLRGFLYKQSEAMPVGACLHSPTLFARACAESRWPPHMARESNVALNWSESERREASGRVVGAYYGCHPTWKNVTAELIATLSAPEHNVEPNYSSVLETLLPSTPSALFGDPVPGRPKRLVLCFMLDSPDRKDSRDDYHRLQTFRCGEYQDAWQGYTLPSAPLLLRTPIRLAVACTFRDSLLFMREWLEFYRMLGATRFYLQDHRSSDREAVDALLAPYIAVGLVHLERCDAEPLGQMAWLHEVQNEFYRRTLIRAQEERVDWLACLDMDEFLYPRETATSTALDVSNLPATLDAVARDPERRPVAGADATPGAATFSVGGVVTQWRNFGTSAVERLEADATLIGSLTRCEAEGAHTCPKLVVRPALVLDLESVHDFSYVLGAGAVSGDAHLLLNHYSLGDEIYCRTVKIPFSERLGGARIGRQRHAAYNACEDTRISRFVGPLRTRLDMKSSAEPTRSPYREPEYLGAAAASSGAAAAIALLPHASDWIFCFSHMGRYANLRFCCLGASLPHVDGPSEIRGALALLETSIMSPSATLHRMPRSDLNLPNAHAPPPPERIAEPKGSFDFVLASCLGLSADRVLWQMRNACEAASSDAYVVLVDIDSGTASPSVHAGLKTALRDTHLLLFEHATQFAFRKRK